ncbi:MAG: PPC domain-containing protein [Planctomycetes bacterium]|nr:PPC domain-containing protein [Planctomycetota bacterium]
MAMTTNRIGLSVAVILAALASEAMAQQGAPHVGYVWPAGARQGETVEVTIGGQYFKDAKDVHVSGGGVTAEILEHIAPLAGKEMQQLRESFDKARKKQQEEAKAGRRAGPLVLRRFFVDFAHEAGLTDKHVEAFQRYREQRDDPKRQLNPQLSESLKVRLTVAADAEPGIREVRVTTRKGLSEPLRFQVGRLAEFRETEPNDRVAEATAVPSLPMVLNGQIMPGDVDYFRFKAEHGQRIVIEVSARSLIPYLADAVPGWFQATATLYDAGGREVAFADDYRFDPDPVLLYEVPTDGEYVLEIRDSIYRGREDFVYRVTVGELPFVASIFPLGGRQGKALTVEVDGWNIPADQCKVSLTPQAAGIRPLSVRGPLGTSNAVPLAIDDLPECLEQEPNDEAAKAAKLTMPVIVNGRIDRPGDVDVFRFHAEKGDQVVAEVLARRLGSPLDSILNLCDAKGNSLAVCDDCEDKGSGLVTHHADSHVAATIPETGDYLLRLGDVQGGGGSDYGYRLRVSRGRPDFELRIAPSALNVRGGASVPVTVYALRRDGFSGPIQLRLKDAPKDFVLAGAVLPDGQDQVRVTLTAPPKPEEQFNALYLEGVATIGGREVCHEAVPADDMMQAFIYRHLVPAERWVVAVDPGWRQATWEVEGETPIKLRTPGTTQVRAKMPGRALAGKIEVELSDPPDGLTVKKAMPVPGGMSIVFETDPEKLKLGLKGNLILNLFIYREVPPKEGQPATGRTRRDSLGTLPAVPFEIVGG